MIINDYDVNSKFYKLLSAESLIRNLAAKYSNAYMVGIFGSSRQIFEQEQQDDLLSRSVEKTQD